VNARGLYERLRYELAPVAVTTMGPCFEGCGGSARGSGVCVACLEAKLQSAVPEVNWPEFVQALKVSREQILLASEAVYG
jgi:hypothetical protein